MYYQYEPLADEYIFQEFLKDVFNRKYSTGSFEEYRSRGYSQFGVDVYSAGQKVAVQAKKKDLSRSVKKLVKELLKELQETVDLLIKFPHPVDQVYFASNTKKFPEVQDKAIQLSIEHNKIILFYCWEDLQKDISIYPDIRKHYYPHLNQTLFAKELVAVGRISTDKIFGRNNIIAILQTKLENNKLVLLQGIGGLGKSTTAKLFYQKTEQNYDHRLWLDGIQNFKQDIARNQALLTGLHCEFNATDSVEHLYEIIFTRLKAVPGKLLIVVDDLRHEEGKIIEPELMRWLSRENTFILITSREAFQINTKIELEALSFDHCKQLFNSFYTKPYNDQELNGLLTLINFNSLLTEILAKNLQSSATLTLLKVIEDINNNQLSPPRFRSDIEHLGDGRSAYESVYTQINNVFNFSDHTEFEWYVLRLLSILPPVNLPLPELLDFFFTKPDERPRIIEAVNSLTIKGLIVRETDEIRCHPLIQDIVLIQTEDYFIYSWIFTPIIHRLKNANSAFSNEGHRLQFYAEQIIKRLKGPKTLSIGQPLLLLKNNLFIAYRYLGLKNHASNLIKDIELSLDDVQLRAIKDNPLLATVLNNIAIQYLDEYDFENAEKFCLKSIAVQPEGFSEQKIYSFNTLYGIKLNTNDFQAAAAYCNDALELLQTQDIIKIGYLTAIIYNDLSNLYVGLNQPKWAWNFTLSAIHNHAQCKNPEKNAGAFASYYLNGAYILLVVGKPEEAVKLVPVAISQRKSLKLQNDPGMVEMLNQAIKICKDAGREDMASKYEKELKELANV